MGHDDQAAGRAVASAHHGLEPGQAVEVEVVGGLVEQRDVEAREQDGGQGQPGRLTPGQLRGRPAGQGTGQAHLVEGGGQAGLDVARGERLVAGQGGRVALLGPVAAAAQAGRRLGQLRLRRGDPGPPQQRLAHGLVARAGVLLAQVAHGGRRRIEPDGARGGRQEAGQKLEEGGLADTVGADDAQAGRRRDGERDVLEDGPAAAFEVQVSGGERGRRGGGGRRHDELRDGRVTGTAARGRRARQLYLTAPAYRPGAGKNETTRWQPSCDGCLSMASLGCP